MGDQFFGGEISEFVYNRQFQKIQYLQEENKQLQEQLKDIEKALKLNKEVLRLTLDSNPNNSTNSTNSGEQMQSKQLLLKLHEENENLRDQTKKLTEERNLAQNKVLLQSQISEENQSFYKDIIQELEEKLAEMRRCIQDKEYTIQDIEKNRGLIDNNQMVKIREIVTPNEQSLRLHEELESTRQILNKLSQESQNLQEQNYKLKEENQIMKRELINVRIILRSPLSYYKMKNFIYNHELENSDENRDQRYEMYNSIPYHDPEQQQQEAPAVVPQQQTYGYQTTYQGMKHLSNNERAIYQEKVQKSESLLKGYKELFEKEKNKTILLTQIKEDIERKLEESHASNEQLIYGIKLKEQKIEQLQAEVNYYRTQYGNYIHLLKNKRQLNLNLSFQQKDTHKQYNHQIQESIQIQKQEKKNENEDDQILYDLGKQINISFLEDPSPEQQKKLDNSELDLRTNKRQSTINQQYQMDYQDCKQFLLNTAKELYLAYNLKMNNLQKKKLMDPKTWGKPKPIWHAKSSSDPLDYFTMNVQNLQLSNKGYAKQDDEFFKVLGKKKINQKEKNLDIFEDLSVIKGIKQVDKLHMDNSFTLEGINDN